MSNSVYSKNSRYVHGGTTEITPSRLEWWERASWDHDYSDGFYTLEKIYEGRPDNLAFAIYGDSSLFWVILQYNNILDPTEEFIEGKRLRIPTKERVMAEFLSGNPGGVPSTRNK